MPHPTQEAVKMHLQLCNDYSCTRVIQRDDLRADLQRRQAQEADNERAARQMAGMHMNAQVCAAGL
jgi:hypothetical protein